MTIQNKENEENGDQNLRQPAYDIDPIFIERWSARSFSNRDVSDDELFSILEAARWAPSANNIQPWRFIVARKAEDREKFYDFILPGNRLWCEKAPVLVPERALSQLPWPMVSARVVMRRFYRPEPVREHADGTMPLRATDV